MNRGLLLLLFLGLTASAKLDARMMKKGFELEPLFKDKGFDMSAELGVLATSGNNNSSSLLGKINASNEWNDWRFKYKFSSLFRQNEKFDKDADRDKLKTTAEKYLLSLQADYEVTETSAGFAYFDYTDDRFATYLEYMSFFVGYSFRALERENMLLDLNLGPGYARGLRKPEEDEDGNQLEKGVAIRGSVAFEWQLSDSAKFTNNISVQTAGFNTRTIAEASLTTKITGSMQMKVGIKGVHNSDVKPDRENLDTQTSVTLVVNI